MNKQRIERKIAKEKKLVFLMVQIYCKANHHQGSLCKECQALIDYAYQRIDKCPFMETKTFCSNCKVHCYQNEKRQKIKKVMRYSGPRMLYHHPIVAISHALSTWRNT